MSDGSPSTPPADVLEDAAELVRRVPVWTALAELFVAGELDVPAYRAMADTLTASGYSLRQLDGILRDEVAPVFSANLSRSPTPEMFAWPEAQVRDLVLAHLRRARRTPAWLPTSWWRDRQTAVVRDEWAAVQQLLGGRVAGARDG